MSEVKFEREGRYIVIKPDFMESERALRLWAFIEEMCFETPDCVVVEADWPEYEPVWKMIEQRVTGQPREDFDAQRLRADTAEANFNRCNGLYYECQKERNTLRSDLAAAEQRIAELEADKARIDWLEEQPVDTLYLDDGRIIDIAGRIDLRKAIDNAIFAALNPNPEAESHE